MRTLATILPALVLLAALGLGGGQAHARSFEDVIGLCETVRSTGKVPGTLAKMVKTDPTNALTRKGEVQSDVGKLFLTLVVAPQNDGTEQIVCLIEGAAYQGGKWRGDVTWDAVGKRLQALYRATKPRGAQAGKNKLKAGDVEKIGFEFFDCSGRGSLWMAGPAYRSDGGFLFPPSVKWRMEGAVFTFLTQTPMFPAMHKQKCG